MPENQAPQSPSRILAAPPGLQLIGADAAGVCADGHCTLPPAVSASADGADGGQAPVDAKDATASHSDRS
ncbi:hypothetical protein ACIPV2_03140 [Microbacterium sp. NPDC089987]|uniref:hypothetical protein n=1 Tax=Microbacterium sp. NPDC089987 TaxID=3364202 RepID=UPI0037FEEC7F